MTNALPLKAALLSLTRQIEINENPFQVLSYTGTIYCSAGGLIRGDNVLKISTQLVLMTLAPLTAAMEFSDLIAKQGLMERSHNKWSLLMWLQESKSHSMHLLHLIGCKTLWQVCQLVYTKSILKGGNDAGTCYNQPQALMVLIGLEVKWKFLNSICYNLSLRR